MATADGAVAGQESMFLRIPLEIRQMIYDADRTEVFRKVNKNANVFIRDFEFTPSLFGVSRSIKSEVEAATARQQGIIGTTFIVGRMSKSLHSEDAILQLYLELLRVGTIYDRDHRKKHGSQGPWKIDKFTANLPLRAFLRGLQYLYDKHCDWGHTIDE